MYFTKNMRLIVTGSVGIALLYLPFSGFFTKQLPASPLQAKATLTAPTTPTTSWLQRREQQQQWVDSVYAALTDDERIGQLLMLRAHSDKGADYEAAVQQQIIKCHAGGVCFFQGTPARQAVVTNSYQAVARLPLLVAIDGEWGLSMRLKNTTTFPRQMTLGAIQNNDLIYQMGVEIARQCKRIGINTNFAPVIDCNTNPKNPVIGDRSFGEDKMQVAAKGILYANGMQDNGVMACAKHFPGHGDADVDSHLELPVIAHDAARLNDIELFPFKALVAKGVMSMMVAHLSVPALDDTPHQPSSLSRRIVTDILRKQLNFDGLIFTDGMEMGAVVKYYTAGKADVQALVAGNDVILLPQSPEAAFAAIKNAVADGTLDKTELEQKVKRVLGAKYKLGLHTRPADIDLANLDRDLNAPEADALRRQLYQNALTLVRNTQNAVPITEVATTKMASVAIGASAPNTFQRTLISYGAVTPYNTGKEIDPKILAAVKNKDVVFVSLHGISRKASDNFGVSQATIRFINTLAAQTKVVVTVFGSPYALRNLDSAACVIAAYEDNKTTQELAAQGIFGAFGMTGKLPVTASAQSNMGDGVGFKSLNRLRTAIPEEVGLNSDTLAKIDGLANELVNNGTAPGCQVMVVKNGAIVYHHTFGYWTYDKTRRVDSTDIYDMASVTKVMATTPSLMTLYDQAKFDPERTMGDYLPELIGTNKAALQIKQVMAHQAGLTAWIPFYKQTLDEKGKWRRSIYAKQPDEEYSVPVANGLFMRHAWIDEMWRQIYASEITPNPKYKYSDLGFFMFAKMVRAQSGEPLDVYAQKNIYEPLGMSYTTFKPLEKFDLTQIVPSENDHYWRQQLVQGTVHDMGAAMLGGVSGHAGLFSTAHDVATYFQMLLNGGEYGGKRIINAATVQLFTTRVAGSSRRALGFDMKDLAAEKLENVSPLVSNNCFGHTGFVGQGVWADPDKQLIFIFLSNRTFPTMENNKLKEQHYREKMQTIIYKALQ